MVSKRGQMKLSFGRIFSIILTIVFISFAIYGITQFLNLKDSAQAGMFRDNFKSDLEKIWRSSEASKTNTYSLPSDYSEVCIENLEENDPPKNLFMHTEEKEFPDEYEVKCGDGANCMNVPDSESCSSVEDGEVSFRFKKSTGEAQVDVTAA